MYRLIVNDRHDSSEIVITGELDGDPAFVTADVNLDPGVEVVAQPLGQVLLLFGGGSRTT